MNRKNLLPDVKDGFSFYCQQCGRCCSGTGEGFVFLYDKELPKIAKRLRISIQECVTKYVDIINSEYKVVDKNLNPTKNKIFLHSLVLRQDEKDGSCVFLDNKTNLCEIYGSRPYQCKSWPMWYPLMTQRKELNEAKKKCPGFKSKDGFITNSQILASLETELKTEYNFMKKMKRNDNELEKCYRFLRNIKFNINKSV
ncbi:MAG: YkgJ family cysteine cluster protein [Promethearchaeota archaeon]